MVQSPNFYHLAHITNLKIVDRELLKISGVLWMFENAASAESSPSFAFPPSLHICWLEDHFRGVEVGVTWFNSHISCIQMSFSLQPIENKNSLQTVTRTVLYLYILSTRNYHGIFLAIMVIKLLSFGINANCSFRWLA